LSFLSDSYVWELNTEITHTGLDGTEQKYETPLVNTKVARGLRVDFVPRWVDDHVYPSNDEDACTYSLIIDLKFKKVKAINKKLFAIMDLGATVD
jgi:hypothetical protein